MRDCRSTSLLPMCPQLGHCCNLALRTEWLAGGSAPTSNGPRVFSLQQDRHLRARVEIRITLFDLGTWIKQQAKTSYNLGRAPLGKRKKNPRFLPMDSVAQTSSLDMWVLIRCVRIAHRAHQMQFGTEMAMGLNPCHEHVLGQLADKRLRIAHISFSPCRESRTCPLSFLIAPRTRGD